MRAKHTRMGGIPKAFIGDDSEEHRHRVDCKINECFQESFVSLKKAQTTPLRVKAGTQDEWMARFPQKKEEQLRQQWIEHRKLRKHYDSFVKKEKSVYDVESDPVVWLEAEALYVSDKLDPRGISVPSEEVRVEAGPWADALNRALYRSYMHQVYYNPGNTPLQTSEWFEWAYDQVRAKKLPWALAVQGDDSLFIYWKGGVVVVLCADMSRYDMSIRVAHMMNVWRFLEWLNVDQPATKALQVDQQYKRTYHTPYGKYIVEGTMASGDSVTISFNSIILMMAFISWFEEQSDFPKFMNSIGFSVTYKETNMSTEPPNVDFLQCRPWMTRRGCRVFGPKPGRILSRLFWIDKTYGREIQYLQELKTMVIGLWPLASHVPIINDLLLNLVELLRDVEPVGRRFDGPQELANWFEGSSEDEHPCTISEMCDLYGLQYEDLDDLRYRCKNWNFDGPIDNNPALTETVRRIARVDLE